jgi:DGQHR domain-containing protein
MNRQESIVIKAIPNLQRIGEFLIASIPAKTLVKISHADIRRMENEDREVERYLGIQRPLSKTRVKGIKKYLEGRDATFPTAVIIAIDDEWATYDEAKMELTISPYADGYSSGMTIGKIAKVLDGQHRIAAFMTDDDEWDSRYDAIKFDFNVSIFIGLDISEQANIFATVNLAQTKVNKNLVYDLTELAKHRSPFKTCHNIAVALDSNDKSPLYKRIKRLGVATPGRKYEPITQAAFVESLVKFISNDPFKDRNDLLEGKKPKRADAEEMTKTPFRNLFLDKKDLDIAEILMNYFNAVQKRWPKSWSDVSVSGNLLPKSNAFKALMRFLKDDICPNIPGISTGKIPLTKEFAKFFADVELNDSDFTTHNFAPGSGGQSVFLQMLRGTLKLKDMIL